MSFSGAFPDRDFMASTTAKMLLEIGAVDVRPEKPFVLTSGLASPVYVDCRKVISYPRVRNTLMDFSVSILLREVGFQGLDAVAGGETAGIPFAAWIADKMELPMQYVRKKPKGFGRAAQVEGDIRDGQRVLLVEDLATNGGSKIRFCDALRSAGAVVSDAIVIFFYDIFPEARRELRENGLRLHALATWRDVLAECRRNAVFDAGRLSEVEAFLDDPFLWSNANGGAGEPAG